MYSYFFLNSLLLLFFLITQYFYDVIHLEASEGSTIEIFQLFIIFLGLIINIKYKKILIKLSSKIAYYLRLFIFSAILYEEISYLTKGILNLSNNINTKGEFNLHNLVQFSETGFLNVNIPIFNYSCK